MTLLSLTLSGNPQLDSDPYCECGVYMYIEMKPKTHCVELEENCIHMCFCLQTGNMLWIFYRMSGYWTTDSSQVYSTYRIAELTIVFLCCVCVCL